MPSRRSARSLRRLGGVVIAVAVIGAGTAHAAAQTTTTASTTSTTTSTSTTSTTNPGATTTTVDPTATTAPTTSIDPNATTTTAPEVTPIDELGVVIGDPSTVPADAAASLTTVEAPDLTLPIDEAPLLPDGRYAAMSPAGLGSALLATSEMSRQLAAANRSLGDATAARDVAAGAIAAAQQQVSDAEIALASLEPDSLATAQRAADAKERLVLAASASMTVVDPARKLSDVIAGDLTEMSRRSTYGASVVDQLSRFAGEWRDRRKALDDRTGEAAAALGSAQAALTTAESALAAAEATLTAATAARNAAALLVSGHQAGPVEGIPVRMLSAYVRAADLMAITDPECHLPWWALAGIGRVESGHGRSGGAVIDAGGLVAPPIRGPVLDGAGPVARIVDSDGGRYDGDTTFDRAVGPMQFLPSTWRGYATDANLDGVADPNNADDAAAGAARYLCRNRGPDRLDTEAGMRRASFAYNHSDSYVNTVWRGAAPYRVAALGAALSVPRRVVIVGDSLAVGATALFRGALEQRGIAVTIDAKISRPSSAGAAAVASVVAAEPADTLVVVALGTNDGSARAIRRSVADVLAAAGGRQVTWVLPDRPGSDEMRLAISEADLASPQLSVIDTSMMRSFSGQLYAADGVHMSRAGSLAWSTMVVDAIS